MALDPGPVAGQVVVAEHVHILHLPFKALPVFIVPGAVAAALLGPQVYHLAGVVGRVRDNRCKRKRDAHVEGFDEVVVEVLVDPQEEVLVFVE